MFMLRSLKGLIDSLSVDKFLGGGVLCNFFGLVLCLLNDLDGFPIFFAIKSFIAVLIFVTFLSALGDLAFFFVFDVIISNLAKGFSKLCNVLFVKKLFL